MMVGERVLALAALLVVFVPRGVSAFSSGHVKSPFYPSKSISPPANPPSKSYSHIPSHPSPPISTPVKQYLAPPSQPVYPGDVAPPSQPLYPGYGASSTVYGQPSAVVVPMVYPVYVSPSDLSARGEPAKPHQGKEEVEEEVEKEELQCDKAVPIFLPREIFTPQDEPANPAQVADLFCNFDDFENGVNDGLCSWTNDDEADFDWTVNSGSTDTANTGPSFDHTTGSAAGFYVYFEVSNASPNDQVELVSPMLDGSAKCLTFWYHRFGSQLGDLIVYIRTGSMDVPVLTISSPSNDAWMQATLSLSSLPSSATPYRIVIEADAGNGEEGNIAIDDISFAAGLCEADSEPSFFVALNDRLKAEHCHKKSATGCKRFEEDGPFQAIADYIWNFCKRDFSSPTYLKDLVLSYCKYHSNDNAVKMAYDCSTGCKLADHINQVCHTMKLVPVCPDNGFNLINGRCYRLYDETADRVSWNEAQVRCLVNGANLASIETEAENVALDDLLGSASGDVWLGMTDFLTNNEFNWLGSTVNMLDPLVFDDFRKPDEPSNNGDCGLYELDPDKWEDEPCGNHNRFLCEKTATIILDHPAAAATP